MRQSAKACRELNPSQTALGQEPCPRETGARSEAAPSTASKNDPVSKRTIRTRSMAALCRPPPGKSLCPRGHEAAPVHGHASTPEGTSILRLLVQGSTPKGASSQPIALSSKEQPQLGLDLVKKSDQGPEDSDHIARMIDLAMGTNLLGEDDVVVQEIRYFLSSTKAPKNQGSSS